MSRFFLCCLLLMPFVTLGQGNIITLKDKNESFLIGKKTYFLEDETAQMTFKEVLQADKEGKFIQNNNDVFARMSTTSAFWFKITVQNNCEEDAWLEVGTTFAWFIDFYAEDSTGKYNKPYLTGTMRPENKRDYDITNGFWLPLNKSWDNKPRTYYIRILEEMPYEAPLRIGTIRSLYENKNINDYLTAGFVGVLLIMFLYNGFLYISTKDHIYGYYLGYLSFALWMGTHLNGYTLLVDNVLAHRFFGVSNILYCFIGLFCIYYLDLSKNLPWVSKLILFELSIVGIILPILNLLGVRIVHLANFSQVFILMEYFTCLFAAYYLSFTRHHHARYYALGWTFFMLSAIIFILVINGILPYTIISRNSVYFGVALEVCMFSLALADRMNIIRREKEEAQAEVLIKIKENEKILKEQNQLLEYKVQERTEELQGTNEELNSTVEELNVTMEVLDRNKKIIEVINRKITSSINSAQSIQGAILQNEDHLQRYLPNYFLIYRPKDIVSGDFYWIHPTKNSLMVVVADCTGHGVAGAFMSIVGINLLNNMKPHMDKLDPAEILYKLNQGVQETLKQEKRDTYDEGMDVSICKIIPTSTDEVVIEFAGAKRPLCYVQKETNILIQVKGDRKSIGSRLDSSFYFNTHKITLSKEDTVYLCTDGYEDQNNCQRRKIGQQLLYKTLSEIAHKPTEEQKEILQDLLINHQFNTDQRDDITLLGIRLA